MSIQLNEYVRKPFRVQAIEVTPENIQDVAAWCGGEVRDSDLSKRGGLEGSQQFIKVQVRRPLNDRQTRAYPGDWVVLAAEGSQPGPAGFKVYTPKAFTGSFQSTVDHMMETVQLMNARAAAEEKAEQEETLFSDHQ